MRLSVWLIALFAVGCHAPDDALVLTRWTLVSPSNQADINIELPRYLNDLVPASQAKYTIRTVIDRPGSWANQSTSFVFPDLDADAVLRVNGITALPTQKPAFGAPIGRGVRQWFVPAGLLDNDTALHLELEFQNAWYMSTWLDTVPYLQAIDPEAPHWPLSFNQTVAIVSIAISFTASLTMFLLWLSHRRDVSALYFSAASIFIIPWLLFELGIMQELFGAYAIGGIGIGAMLALTFSFYQVHATFGLGRVPWLVPIVQVGIIATVLLLGKERALGTVYLVGIMGGAGVAWQAVIGLRLVLRQNPPLNAWMNLSSWVPLFACVFTEIPSWLGKGESLGGIRLVSIGFVCYCLATFLSLGRQAAHAQKQAQTLNVELQQRLTEKQSAEKALTAAANAWRTTFDAIGAGVCLLDRDARIMRGNRAMATILGQPVENLPGRDLTKAISGDTWLPAGPTSNRDSWSSRHREKVIIEHAKRWYSVAIDPVVDEQQGSIGSVYVMTDITGQRELEQQLFQTQKMDAVGRLAGGVAHDFNNLLSVIISYGEFISEECPVESLRADAREIVAAGHRAAELTRQLLVFSRKQVLKPQTHSPNAIITDLTNMLARLIGEKITLKLCLDPAVGFVYFDKGQLEQVLVNLVVNARDANPKGGEIIVETRLVELDTASQGLDILESGVRVAIAVRDKGTGMTDEVKRKVFDPFFTTKEPGQGTGLGLSMVYGAVKQAGGTIEIESALGAGTNFTIYLPHYVTNTERRNLHEELKQVTGSGETVLVVDDDAAVRAAMSKILRRGGYRVVEAGSGEEAIGLFDEAADDVQLLITDVVMPGMNGPELSVLLQKMKPNLSVLYVSGYGFETFAKQGMDPAMLNIVSKPFTRAEVLGAVAKILDLS